MWNWFLFNSNIYLLCNIIVIKKKYIVVPLTLQNITENWPVEIILFLHHSSGPFIKYFNRNIKLPQNVKNNIYNSQVTRLFEHAPKVALFIILYIRTSSPAGLQRTIVLDLSRHCTFLQQQKVCFKGWMPPFFHSESSYLSGLFSRGS